MSKVTKEVIEEVGATAREALEQGRKFGEDLQEKVIEPVQESYSGMREAQRERAGAEREARIMERAVEIKKAHPKVPGRKAVEHARNEDEAGLLKR